jgi:MoxR-like ATPase
MFNMILDYPSFEEEVNIVKSTTGNIQADVKKVLTINEILKFQELVKRVPVPDNIFEYAVGLTTKTRKGGQYATKMVNDYLDYGAGPRASQYLIIGAKTHALMNGKYSPDIDNVQAIAKAVLRHRVVRNYKAEAEGISSDHIIESLF